MQNAENMSAISDLIYSLFPYDNKKSLKRGLKRGLEHMNQNWQ